MSKLDDVLDQPLSKTQDDAYDGWKQQVKALIHSLIGKDEPLEHPNAIDNVLAAAQNALRDEIRKKIEKL